MYSNGISGLTPRSVKAASLHPAGRAKRRLKHWFDGIAFRADSENNALARGFIQPAHHMPLLTLDHGLVALGVAAAIGSAAFAGYMMTHENNAPVFGGAEHLRLFAQPLYAPSRRAPFEAVRVGARAVDYSATGSIRYGGSLNHATGRKSASLFAPARGKMAAEPQDMPIEAYVVRFVHNGLAIVQSRKGSYAAAPGVYLPGAGRVLSIQKRSNRWVVVTASGLITEPSF